MNSYFLKRILLFFPALASVLLLTMILGHFSGEIPSSLLMDREKGAFSEEEINRYREKSGLNEPFFYFSIKVDNFSFIYYPLIDWNGSQNRFHRYCSNVIKGDFGYSIFYRTEVWNVIKTPFLRTLLINIIVIGISYFLGIYIGYVQALRKKVWLGSSLRFAGDFFYSFPVFWLAILLLWSLANQQIIQIFPANGWIWNSENGIFWAVLNLLWSLVLPILCLSLGSIAYIAAVFNEKLESEMEKPYYKALIGRGMEKEYILKKHLFKVALIPLIAISTDLLPSLISGSVIIESIFNIPGMGKLVFDAFFARDFPIIYTVTLFASVLTWINWILADYLYSRLDPRIKF